MGRTHSAESACPGEQSDHGPDKMGYIVRIGQRANYYGKGLSDPPGSDLEVGARLLFGCILGWFWICEWPVPASTNIITS